MEGDQRRRSTRIAVSALFAVAALAASALAATGDLTPKGCVDDLPPQGPDTCAGSAAGLDNAESIAVSRDGVSVYVAASEDDAIVAFTLDGTGALVPQGCVEDTGQDECDDESPGLDGIHSIALSANGKSLYAASDEDDAVVSFTRNKQTGELTPQGCIEDTGQDECAEEADGLDEAKSVAVSADNKSVYVASAGDEAIARFKRNEEGALSSRGCIEDTGEAECDVETPALRDARWVAVSRDGKSVYVAAVQDDAIVAFKRNKNSGAISPAGCVDAEPPQGPDTCGDSGPGLNGAHSVAVSPDGESVYVASTNDDAIARFKRIEATGVLLPKGCVADSGQVGCAKNSAGLGEAQSAEVSPDGKSVYVAAEADDAVVHLKRKASGALKPKGCVEDNGQDECVEETAGLDAVVSVAVSADGGSVYAASAADDAIVRFKREK